MRELHQQYNYIQKMPLIELIQFASIVQESVEEMKETMEDAKGKMNSGMNKFRVKR